jgi:hypothetical protein
MNRPAAYPSTKFAAKSVERLPLFVLLEVSSLSAGSSVVITEASLLF